MNQIDNSLIEQVVQGVIAQLNGLDDNTIPLELSNRHVHLSEKDSLELFGSPLSRKQDLSQPGQYLCNERLRIIGPKGVIDNVAILGPTREESQVELSLTDARKLGMDLPIRQSGDIQGTPGIVLSSGKKIIAIDKGVIVAGRHIHMSPTDAKRFGVIDRQIVCVHMQGKRPAIFNDVLIRVHKDFKLAMHIDFDEANGCGCDTSAKCQIVTAATGAICAN